MTISRIARCLITLIALTFSCMAQAQDHGHSDIEFSYADSRIDVEPGGEGFVFEGEFGEGVFSHVASEPGFASETEEGMGIGPSDLIGYNVLGPLYYWDGTQFNATHDASVTVAGVGGAADTVLTAGSATQLASFEIPSNLVGQADAEGDFHTDLDFTLSDNAAMGGYGMVLSLSSNAGVADSQPIGIFLNFGGLPEAQFEAGVEAFSAVVPEPNSGCLAISAVLLGACARRRRRVSGPFNTTH